MATKKQYEACIAMNRLKKRVTVDGSYKPGMRNLFGEKLLVTESQFKALGEVEQARHFQEDAVLRFLYIEN